MPSVFLDTNVVIYAATGRKNEPVKAEIAQNLIDQQDFGLSVQVLQEFYDKVRSPKLGLSEEQTNAWIANLLEFDCAPIDPDIVVSAIGLAQRYRIRYWDAALLAACRRMGIATLVTEDLNHGQSYAGVTVRNPFIQT